MARCSRHPQEGIIPSWTSIDSKGYTKTMTALLQVYMVYFPQVVAFLFLLFIFWRIRRLRIISEQKKRLVKEKDTIREDSLLWISTSFNSHIASIKEAITNLNFPVEQRLNNPPDWKILKHQVKRLELLGQRLKAHLQEETA